MGLEVGISVMVCCCEGWRRTGGKGVYYEGRVGWPLEEKWVDEEGMKGGYTGRAVYLRRCGNGGDGEGWRREGGRVRGLGLE